MDITLGKISVSGFVVETLFFSDHKEDIIPYAFNWILPTLRSFWNRIFWYTYEPTIPDPGPVVAVCGQKTSNHSPTSLFHDFFFSPRAPALVTLGWKTSTTKYCGRDVRQPRKSTPLFSKMRMLNVPMKGDRLTKNNKKQKKDTMDVGVQFFLFFRSFHQLGRFGTLINRNGKKQRGTAGVFFVFLCRSANSWFGNEIYQVTNRRIEIRDKIPIPNGTTYFDCRGIPKPNQYCFSLLKSDNLFFFVRIIFYWLLRGDEAWKKKKRSKWRN